MQAHRLAKALSRSRLGQGFIIQWRQRRLLDGNYPYIQREETYRLEGCCNALFELRTGGVVEKLSAGAYFWVMEQGHIRQRADEVFSTVQGEKRVSQGNGRFGWCAGSIQARAWQSGGRRGSCGGS